MVDTATTKKPRTRACTSCRRVYDAAELVVKRADYRRAGAWSKDDGTAGRVVRIRVTAHLCPACLEIDDDFNLPARPGAHALGR